MTPSEAALRWLATFPRVTTSVPVGMRVHVTFAGKYRVFDWALWLSLRDAGLVHLFIGSERADVKLSALGAAQIGIEP